MLILISLHSSQTFGSTLHYVDVQHSRPTFNTIQILIIASQLNAKCSVRSLSLVNWYFLVTLVASPARHYAGACLECS